MNTKTIVITGGPGTGKSSLINELTKRGFTCFEEISREIIIKAKAEGIEQLFLTDPIKFSELLLDGRIKQFKEANASNNEFVFLDRGIPRCTCIYGL
ncbi:ATP-binding protein [Lacinutrix neustonica]|uniref:ATP-binding protein n=1 Tax=Lacinutrix neustonica TaxID=2980107 RepID=UPI0028BE89F7|nr:ATP-binding protein [Lacinutrix neustonica]